MKQREMQKLITTGEVVVTSATYERLKQVAHAQGKSVSLLADEAINRALDALTAVKS